MSTSSSGRSRTWTAPSASSSSATAPCRRTLEEAAADAGVADRVTWTGAIDEAGLLDLYAGALGVVFPPFDEDYGYVTLEAFLARKPVVTTTDAGGPLEFVEHGDHRARGRTVGRSHRRRHRPPRRRSAVRRSRWATRDTIARVPSHGTAWWIVYWARPPLQPAPSRRDGDCDPAASTSIVIPAFNEAASIAPARRRIARRGAMARDPGHRRRLH